MGNDKRNVVIVGGAGHVGLPLGLALADVGHNVVAFDIDERKIDDINRGLMPFMEEGATATLNQVLALGKFRATAAPESLKLADVVIVVIGTPVDEHLSPNPNSVLESILKLKDYLNKDQLIILRSTIFPGVTRKLDSKLKEIIPGIRIAYCPERIVEGKALEELRVLPQIIGAYDLEASRLSSSIFSSLGVEVVDTTPEEAELAKLFTNVWRYMKFAIANQFWMISNDYGVDFDKVRNAITKDYPRASDLPSAGLTAGPCLFKDTMQLAALAQNNFPLGHSAMLINEGIPAYIINKLEKKYDFSEMKIGILGMAFKANSDDIRSSLAYKLRKLLLFKANEVLISDPFVKDTRLCSMEFLLENSDLIIIGAPHTNYLNLKFSVPVFDIWGIYEDSITSW